MSRHASLAALSAAFAAIVACSNGSGLDLGSGGAVSGGPTGNGGPGSGTSPGGNVPGTTGAGGSSGAPSGSGGGAPSGAGGANTPNTNFGKGGAPGNSGGPTPMKNCGLQTIPLKRLPAELMLVLDRSGSMTDMVAGFGQKWAAVTDALNTVLTKTQASVYWGLKLFPSDRVCGVSPAIEVDCALNNQGAIAGAVMANPAVHNGGATPTAVAVGTAAAHMMMRTTPNPKFLLLATDGLPNCRGGQSNAMDNAGAVNAVAAAAAAGLHTFVVGIPGDPGADATLNMMADKGLEPRNNPTQHYYPVASKDEFANVLTAITGQISSCTFPLTQTPPSPMDVAVNADGMRVAMDTTHMNGWDYTAGNKSIILYGSWCDKLKSGAVKDVQIIYGCPGMLIP